MGARAKMGYFYDLCMKKLWRNENPYEGFPASAYSEDFQGWGSDNPYLTEAVTLLRPKLVIEIGVWKGGSSITMANKIKELKLDAALISIDTWLGSSEHWIQERYFKELKHFEGYPNLYKQFIKNVLSKGLGDVIIPLPLDSVNASVLLKKLGLEADIIHIDAGHDFRSVMVDLEVWWPVLRKGGQLIGDDYYEVEHWPEVKQAFGAFFSPMGIEKIENRSGKCRINKN